MTYIADRRLYLTLDQQVVEDGDPAANTLLITPGHTLTDDRARALGLMEKKSVKTPTIETPKPEPTAPPAPIEPESKAVLHAPKHKMQPGPAADQA